MLLLFVAAVVIIIVNVVVKFEVEGLLCLAVATC